MSIMAKTPSGYKKIGSVYLGERPVDKVYNANGDVVYALQRELTGVPPLLFKGKEQSELLNYRIYGDTVDGNSVGELVESGEHAGEYKVPVTVEGKNLINSSLESYTTSTGITITVNADKSVTLNTENGTAADTYIYLYRNDTIPESLLNKPVILSGGTSTARVRWWHYDGTNIIESANSDSNIFTATQGAIDIFVPKNTVLNDATIYPMIRKADIEDDTYEPYHAPVTTPIYLPEPIKMVGDEAEYIDYAEQKQHRVRKNLLPTITAAYSKNGILLSPESDGTLNVNGTATATVYPYLRGHISYPFDTILNGCPQGGSPEGYCLRALTMAMVSIVATDFGNGALIPANTEVYIEIRIQNGFECNNLKFKPMIRRADIEDDTYEPYIENTDLDVTLPALPTIKGTNTLSVDTEVQPSRMDIKGRIKTLT